MTTTAPKTAARKPAVAKSVAAKHFAWLLHRDGVLIGGADFSSVLFDYKNKHESTADKYTVSRNPAS